MVADEPTSALDVSVQAKVLDLFQNLQKELGFACLFVTHDLAVVDVLADRICVMQRGRIVEQGTRDQILRNPQEPYTPTAPGSGSAAGSGQAARAPRTARAAAFRCQLRLTRRVKTGRNSGENNGFSVGPRVTRMPLGANSTSQ